MIYTILSIVFIVLGMLIKVFLAGRKDVKEDIDEKIIAQHDSDFEYLQKQKDFALRLAVDNDFSERVRQLTNPPEKN